MGVGTPKHSIEELISEDALRTRIAELGKEISEHYEGSYKLVLVGLLRGSFVFLADLCRKVTVPHEIYFMAASSYGSGMESGRNVKIAQDLDGDIEGKDVLIVEDIMDTGHTLSKVGGILRTRNPRSLKIVTLLDKPERREVEVQVNYVGFTVPDVFVVGMGIDWAQKYRHLPFIGRVTLLEQRESSDAKEKY